MSQKNGQLVSIEGVDGCGKSTLVDNLQYRIEDAVFTTEPNRDSWLEDVIRKAISEEEPTISDMSVFFLFLADHANHVEEVINPAISQGKTVICDRYISSRYVYQQEEIEDYIDGSTLSWIRTVQRQKWTREPDKVIILDIPVDVAMNRLDGGEIFEKENKIREFRRRYLDLAEEDERYYVIDGTKKPASVAKEAMEIINSDN